MLVVGLLLCAALVLLLLHALPNGAPADPKPATCTLVEIEEPGPHRAQPPSTPDAPLDPSTLSTPKGRSPAPLLDLSAGLPQSRVEGYVEDHDGTPLPGAKVRIRHPSGRSWYTRTGARGQFVCSLLDAGHFTIEATAEHFSRESIRWSRGDGAVIRLQREGWPAALEGVVVDHRGDPVSNYAIDLLRADGSLADLDWTLPEDGSAAFRAVASLATTEPSSISLRVRAPGCVEARFGPWTLTHDQVLSGLRLVLERHPPEVTGSLVGPGGEPLMGVEVLVLTRHGDTAGRAVTDRFGCFDLYPPLTVDHSSPLAETEPGEVHRLLAHPPGLAPCELERGRKRLPWHEARLEARPGGAIRGLVLDAAGGAVAGAKVVAGHFASDSPWRLETRSGPIGGYALEGLPAGTCRIVAEWDRIRPSGGSEGDRSTVFCDMRAPAGGSRAYVLDLLDLDEGEELSLDLVEGRETKALRWR